MPFLEGASNAENLDDLDATQQAAVVDALVFLARSGLIYTDLRAANVMLHGPDAFLVDYDDAQLVDQKDILEEVRQLAAESSQGGALWAQVRIRLESAAVAEAADSVSESLTHLRLAADSSGGLPG
jgi:hypothetical protein